MTKDFKWKTHSDAARPGVPLWHVTSGNVLVTVCRNESAAVKMCENLNNDRWFLDRGQTRDDRWGHNSP